MYAKRGLFSPRLLSHDDIRGIIFYVQLRRPDRDYEFPSANFHSAEFSKIGSLKFYKTNYNVYFEFTFSLHTHESYELYKLHPVPVAQRKGSSAFIRPRAPYMMIEGKKKLHAFLTSLELGTSRSFC